MMKFPKKFRLKSWMWLVIGWLAINFVGQVLHAQVVKIEAEDAYVYPIKPKTKAWEKMPNYQARMEACRVPTEAIKKMSTKGLLKAALEHPTSPSIYFFNFRKDGYSIIKSGNDALTAFVRRADAPKVITDLYLSLDADGFEEDWDGIMRGTYSYEITLLTYIILDRDLFKRLKVEEKENLAKSCLEKLLVMQTLPKTYGILTLHETAGFGGRLLLNLGYKPYRKLLSSTSYGTDFLERIPCPNGQTLTAQTIALLKEFSKKKP